MDENKWTRRRVLALSGSAALAAVMPFRGALAGSSLAVAPVSSPALLAVSKRAEELYADAFVLDANTLASIGYLAEQKDLSDGLSAIRASGVAALKSTLGGAGGTYDQVMEELGVTQALVDKHPELFIKVVRPGDLDRARRERKVALILSFEAVSMLDGKVERIELFRQLDVLVMQLTYNHSTPFGVGCLDGDTDGITPLGREAIARMNAIGVALDLSHANAPTTADGIAASTHPSVITHAGCRTVFDHPRNKTDRDMRALAGKGGVMGVYMLPFLAADTRQPGLPDYMRHMVHALNVCGEDHVGIGSDSLFFTATKDDLRAIEKVMAMRRKAGVSAPGENRPPYLPDINTPRKLEFVADALLRHGYSSRVTEKVLGLNFRRVFGEIWVE